jgi:hypothetical protein
VYRASSGLIGISLALSDKASQERSRMGLERDEEMKEDLYVVLSSYERAAVHAVQTRKPGATPVNWKALAQDLKVSENYFKALCTMPLPKSSNEIPCSRIERAIWSISLGRVFLP